MRSPGHSEIVKMHETAGATRGGSKSEKADCQEAEIA